MQLACEVRAAARGGSGGFHAPAASGLGAPAADPPRAGGAARRSSELVRAAFAHRRKPLAGSLELAGGPSRGAVREALGELGLDRGRAGRGARPGGLRPLCGAAGVRMTLRAPAKLNLCLYLGARRRDDGLHEITLALLPADARRPDRRSPMPSADEVVCPGVEGPNLASAALDGAARPRLGRAAAQGGDREAHSGRRRASAGGAPTLRRAAVGGRGAGGDPRARGRAGADVPSQLDPGFALVGGAGRG